MAGPQDRTLTEVGESVEPTDGTNVTIIQSNDIQTAMSDNASVVRLVGAINDRRAAADGPTVVVGGGDEVSPSSLSTVSEWRVPVDVLNVLQPDAEVVGNHDLDYGFEAVSNFGEALEFPWLLANVEAEDGSNVPGIKDYTTVERGGVTIGLPGLVDDAIKSKTAVDFEEESYEVTVNSFMAGGETLSQYETVSETLKLYGTAVVEYIEQQDTIAPPDENRIRHAIRTVESINSSSFTILNETSARLDVQQAELDGSTLTLTVNRAGLVSLTEASDTVQFYGTYKRPQRLRALTAERRGERARGGSARERTRERRVRTRRDHRPARKAPVRTQQPRGGTLRAGLTA